MQRVFCSDEDPANLCKDCDRLGKGSFLFGNGSLQYQYTKKRRTEAGKTAERKRGFNRMLRLYTGVAGTGKTREILRQIRQAAEEGKTDLLLIVPDQFTYEDAVEPSGLCTAAG